MSRTQTPYFSGFKPGCLAEFVSRLKPRPTKIFRFGFGTYQASQNQAAERVIPLSAAFLFRLQCLELVPKVLVIDLVVVLHFGGFDEGTE
jgi:hypothetical protein